MSGHRWWPTISPCSPRSFSPEATKIVERPARRTGECLLMSTLAAATRFASGRLKKSAHPIVAADKARRTNPCKHSIRYRARQKISVYGQTLASLSDASQGTFDVRMSLGPHEEATDRSRSFQRYWIIDVEQCHRPALWPPLPETQQFLTGKLDGNRHRSDLAFPVLNRAATEPELFPRDRLRVSQFPSPLLEAPTVHRVVPQSRPRKMLVLAGTNVRGVRRPMLIRNPVRYGKWRTPLRCCRRYRAFGPPRYCEADPGPLGVIAGCKRDRVGSYAKISPGEPTVPCALFLASLGQ